MEELRNKFLIDSKIGGYTVLVVAIQLPNGAIETITNYHNIDEKIEYYTYMYDEEFRLKTVKDIRIVGYMLV